MKYLNQSNTNFIVTYLVLQPSPASQHPLLQLPDPPTLSRHLPRWIPSSRLVPVVAMRRHGGHGLLSGRKKKRDGLLSSQGSTRTWNTNLIAELTQASTGHEGEKSKSHWTSSHQACCGIGYCLSREQTCCNEWLGNHRENLRNGSLP